MNNTILMDKPVAEKAIFRVVYGLTTYKETLGNTEVQPEKLMVVHTDSNDLHHAFVDISYRHQYDQVCSLRIIEIYSLR